MLPRLNSNSSRMNYFRPSFLSVSLTSAILRGQQIELSSSERSLVLHPPQYLKLELERPSQAFTLTSGSLTIQSRRMPLRMPCEVVSVKLSPQTGGSLVLNLSCVVPNEIALQLSEPRGGQGIPMSILKATSEIRGSGVTERS